MARNPCEINGTQIESDSIAEQYASRMRSLADDLLHGTLSLEDFHTRMQDAIRLSFLHQAVAGTPDADAREIKPRDMQRIQNNIAAQYEYLDNFMTDIENAVQKDAASLEFIPSRAAMYAGAGESEYWRQATNVDLPATPRDGSTVCLTNCACSWRLECSPDGKTVSAFWELGPADHCEDCKQRATEWNPLVIQL